MLPLGRPSTTSKLLPLTPLQATSVYAISSQSIQLSKGFITLTLTWDHREHMVGKEKKIVLVDTHTCTWAQHSFSLPERAYELFVNTHTLPIRYTHTFSFVKEW